MLGFQGKAQLEVSVRPSGRGDAVAARDQCLAHDQGAEGRGVGQQIHRQSRGRTAARDALRRHARRPKLHPRPAGRAAGAGVRNLRPPRPARLHEVPNYVTRFSFPYFDMPDSRNRISSCGSDPTTSCPMTETERGNPDASRAELKQEPAAPVRAQLRRTGGADPAARQTRTIEPNADDSRTSSAGVRTAMLTISKPLSASQAQTYHARRVHRRRAELLETGRHHQGEWRGQTRREARPCRAGWGEDFARLFEGQHPVTGEQLVRHRASMNTKASEARRLLRGASSRLGCDLHRPQVRFADRARRRR